MISTVLFNLFSNDLSTFMEKFAGARGTNVRDSYDLEGTADFDGATVMLDLVYSEGGGEGGGEYVERVYSVTVNGEMLGFVRDQGYYESYNGTEMNGDFHHVQPMQVTVTRYVKPGEKPRV